MELQLNADQTKLLLITKNWSFYSQLENPEKVIENREVFQLKELYKEVYQYKENAAGIFSMVQKFYMEVLSHMMKVAPEQTIHELTMTINNTFPNETWKVGGKNFGLWANKENSLNTEETTWAWILAMCAYLSHLDTKYYVLDKPTWNSLDKTGTQWENKNDH